MSTAPQTFLGRTASHRPVSMAATDLASQDADQSEDQDQWAVTEPVGLWRAASHRSVPLSGAHRWTGEARRKSESFNRAIMDSIPDLLVVLDSEGRIIAVNQAWRRFALESGIGSDQAGPPTEVGANYLAFCQVGVGMTLDDDALNAQAGIKAVLAGSLAHFTLEYACHTPTCQRWLSMSASPLGPQGRGAVIAHTNITDRKHIEAALFAYQDDLEVAVGRGNRQLQAVGRELLASEARERRAIAQDLHDDLGQSLTVAKLKLSTLVWPDEGHSKDEFLRQLKSIEAMIDCSNRSLRSFSTQLSPPALAQLGLDAALEWLAGEMMRTYGLCVNLRQGPLPALDATLSSALFRSVRELLINVWKHARVSAAQVSVAMDAGRDALLIRVSDAGVGFNAARLSNPSTKQSYGLFSIRERITLIGGTLQVDSAVGRGTAVTLTLPSATLTTEAPASQK